MISLLDILSSRERFEAKLIISLVEERDHIIEELKLIGEMKIYEIKLVDTKLPISIAEKEIKIVTVINSGTSATSVDATISNDEQFQNDAKDFFVKPTSRFLQPNEKGYFEIIFNPFNVTVHDR